ncbi:hypothetical protein [Nonomuraea jabiensis]|uniref:hypothetical protein n=1 Tax=Nonomuraea jabiensis TaxID=882448 RepID=UPI003D704F8B
MSTFIPTPPTAHTSGPPAAVPPASPPGPAGAPPGAGEPQPLRWIWETTSPAERRAGLLRLRAWVDWICPRHPEPPLALPEKIPKCWYMHPGPLDRLTALYAEWIRIHAADSELPLISFYDAIDRHAANLGYPGACLHRTHDDQRGAQPYVEFDTWLATSTWVEAPAATYAFQAAPPTDAAQRSPAMPGPPATLPPAQPQGFVLEHSQMQQLLDTGDATQLGGAPAVRLDGCWWLGDGTLWVRVLDRAMTEDLDDRLTRWNAAEAALARHRARTKTTRKSPPPTPGPGQTALTFDVPPPPESPEGN